MEQLEGYLSRIESMEKFKIYRELLLFYNKKFNLTAITDEREILIKHFLDSAAGEKFFPQNSSVVDVGAGAGFPSLPLKILREDLTFTLIESTNKKCEFLSVAVKELGLTGVEILPVRAEDAGKDFRYRESFDCCCARAVARLNTLLEYCLPLVRVGGRMIAYKGEIGEELKEAQKSLCILGGEEEDRLCFSLPENMGERTVLCVKKRAKTPSKYPRGQGKERRDPIV